MPRVVLCLLYFMMLVLPVQAQHHDTGKVPLYISHLVPGAEPVGNGRYSYLFWDVYDAALYAPKGNYRQKPPFGLRLTYLRRISGHEIADASATEIRRQGFKDELKLATWHSQMRQIFPDVGPGISLTGVALPNGHTVIFRNDKKIGVFADSEFTRRFFAIWLDPITSAPALRRSLLQVANEQ